MMDYDFMMQSIVEKQGGSREKEILNGEYVTRKSGTWNKEHKVLNVHEAKADKYGHRAGFSVDLVTKKICG